MKTLQYYLNNLNKSKENEDWVTINPGGFNNNIADELEIRDWDYLFLDSDDVPELKCYWAIKWLCTDTHVGVRLYSLNDEFVCASFQQGRKCDELYAWASRELYIKVRNYVLSKLPPKEIKKMALIDWNEDLSGWERK